MVSYVDRHLSIKLTRFYMRITGFWYAENQREQWILYAVLTYTVFAVLWGMAVEITDLYYSWGNFNATVYNICISLPILMIAFKVTIFIIRRDAILELIRFSEKNFWNGTYDKFGEEILKQCERKGFAILVVLSCAVHGTTCSYLVRPMIENIGKNDSERSLPFRLWVNLPTKVTPYYEIIYMIQSLSTIHSGICYFCFDNLMGILNIHVVGQFKILQHKLGNLCDEYIKDVKADMQLSSILNEDRQRRSSRASYLNSIPNTQDHLSTEKLSKKMSAIGDETYAVLKEYVKQHLLLINYIEKLEYIFSPIGFCQMGLSSIFLCLAGFQLFVVKKKLYILHVTSVLTQMLLFAWTCNEIIIESLMVGEAAYHSKWYMLPYTGAGRLLREGLVLVMIRARRACYISAGKFAPISLSSVIAILSTTLSYLSLMRRMAEIHD